MKKLAETPILWISFIATLVITVLFQIVVGQTGITLLDTIFDPEQSRAAVAAMSESQRVVHAWTTATLDVAYPAAYGAWFVGSAYKFFPKVAGVIAGLIYALVGIDLSEGVVQVLALVDITDWLDSKALLTSAKYALFNFALLMVVAGWLIWVYQKIRGQGGVDQT